MKWANWVYMMVQLAAHDVTLAAYDVIFFGGKRLREWVVYVSRCLGILIMWFWEWVGGVIR